MAAHVLAPPLLPTPPKERMLPSLPTPFFSRLFILPPSFASPKPSPASSDERWDVDKKPGRTSERWDSRKRPRRASSSESRGVHMIAGRGSSCDRLDSHKKPRSHAEEPGGAKNKETVKPQSEETAKVATASCREERMKAVFSRPSYCTSLAPSLLPVPAFLAAH